MSTPITFKSLGKDQRTGLERRINIVSLNIDSVIGIISVRYEISLYAPDDEFVVTEEKNEYSRHGDRFETLQNSSIGKGIKQMLDAELEPVNNISTLEEDLRQK